MISTSLHLFGVLNRSVSPALARVLLPPALAVAMGLVWMLQALPVNEMKRAAAEQNPLAAALTMSGLALVAALVVRPAMRVAWRGPVVELLDRQPLRWPLWSLALTPMVLGLAGPVSLLALLWPWRQPLMGAALLLGQAGVHVICQGRPGLGRWGWSLAVFAVGAAALALARTWPGCEALGPIVSLSGLALLGPARLAGARRLEDETKAAAVRPRGPFSALVARDWLALYRQDRGLLLLVALGVALPWPLLHGLWRNGGRSRSDLEIGALILLALISPSVPMMMSQLGLRLGARLDPSEWPVSPKTRALSLLVLPTLWSGWACLALLSAAPLLPFGALRLVALSWNFSALAVLMTSWSTPAELNVGTWCFCVGCLTVLAVLGGVPAVVASVPLSALLLFWSARRLQHHRRTRT